MGLDDATSGIDADRRGQAAEAELGGWGVPAAIVLLGVVVAALLTGVLRAAETEALTERFKRHAEERAQAVDEKLRDTMEVVRSLEAFYRASREVEPGEFHAFCAALLHRHPAVLALEWVPRVPAAERDAFEERLSRQLGRPARILELDAAGAVRPARPREVYYPVEFVEPEGPNEGVWGLDLASDPVRQAALNAADARSELVVSRRVALVQAPDTPAALVVLRHPTEAEGPGEGYLLAAFRIDQLLRAAVGALDASEVSLGMRVLDRRGDGPPALLFEGGLLWGHQGSFTSGPVPPEELGGLPVQSFPLQALGGGWLVECRVSREYEVASRSWVPLAVPATVLMGALLTALFLALLQRRAERLFRTERALADRESQLRQAQRLEAVGRLSGGIAHDFNNLLTVIIGYVDLLATSGELSPGSHALLDEVARASRRAADLTRQLLIFSRRQPLEIKSLDLGELLGGLERLLRPLIGEDIELVLSLPDEPMWVSADPGQLEQALLNLVVNARDAMPAGGRLEIAVAARGREAVLRVRDTGHGMSPEVQRHIFEPFFTTKPTGRGSGLGLSTVYGIVEASGGRIDVDSAPGRGTQFTIFLPLVAAPEGSQASPEPRRPRTPPPRPARVLLVEDEPALRELLAQAMRGAGYEVSLAGDGQEAWEAWGERLGELDVLVSDVVMPRLGGAELCERVRAARADLPVLLITGYPGDQLQEAGRLPADVQLQPKPFTPDQLLARVGALLERPALVPQRGGSASSSSSEAAEAGA